MTSLIIPDSKATPLIVLDPSTSTFLFAGSSVLENTTEFYAPVMQWMKDHVNTLPEGTSFSFRLDYFNTSSLKAFFFIISAVKEANTMCARNFRVLWYVEDADEFMEDAADNIEAVLDITMERVPVDPGQQPMESLLAQYRMPRSGAA